MSAWNIHILDLCNNKNKTMKYFIVLSLQDKREYKYNCPEHIIIEVRNHHKSPCKKMMFVTVRNIHDDIGIEKGSLVYWAAL